MHRGILPFAAENAKQRNPQRQERLASKTRVTVTLRPPRARAFPPPSPNKENPQHLKKLKPVYFKYRHYRRANVRTVLETFPRTGQNDAAKGRKAAISELAQEIRYQRTRCHPRCQQTRILLSIFRASDRLPDSSAPSAPPFRPSHVFIKPSNSFIDEETIKPFFFLVSKTTRHGAHRTRPAPTQHPSEASTTPHHSFSPPLLLKCVPPIHQTTRPPPPSHPPTYLPTYPLIHPPAHPANHPRRRALLFRARYP